MKRSLLIIFLVFGYFTSFVFSQKGKISCNQSSLLISMLNKYHINPIDLNQNNSEQIFNDFLYNLDPLRCILTDSDLNSISSFKSQLLDSSSGEKACKFTNAIVPIFTNRIQQVDTIISDILSKPLCFNEKDSMVFIESQASGFALNDIELRNRITKLLKFEALELITTYEEIDLLKPDANLFLQKEAEVRKILRIKQKRRLNRILEYPNGIETYVTELLFNAISNRYDPHTLFFTTSEKEQFQASLSKEIKSYGFLFEEKDNTKIEITYIVPGSAAWKCNKLNSGDVITKVKLPNGENYDLSYASESEAENFIYNSPFDAIQLTVKKSNGTIISVELVKSTLISEENIINGYILEGEKKIGYIMLPGFYTDMNNPNGLGCANDIAKEILKLKKENIEGLILDLRNNGGGSLQEAIGLIGLFIDEGPVFIAKGRDEKPMLVKDQNRGSVYSDPLVILVNCFSASASEMVAAGLQDYNRAIIVGSTTFGKAIAQITLPLDTNSISVSKSQNPTSSFINLTTLKLFRLNGESFQYNGVIPDIKFPDFNTKLGIGEASLPYALKSEKIDKKVYFNPLPLIHKFELEQKSNTRIKSDSAFIQLGQLELKEKLFIESNILYLNIDSYIESKTKTIQLEEQIAAILERPAYNYKVIPTNYFETILKADNHKKEINDMTIESINHDIYVQESYNVMKDLINLKK